MADEQELAAKIHDIAQEACHTGYDWRAMDRIYFMKSQLEKIITFCQQHLPKSNKKPCYVCKTLCYSVCCVCDRDVCLDCMASDILPGNGIICGDCDRITPDREQAYRHYLHRAAIQLEEASKK